MTYLLSRSKYFCTLIYRYYTYFKNILLHIIAISLLIIILIILSNSLMKAKIFNRISLFSVKKLYILPIKDSFLFLLFPSTNTSSYTKIICIIIQNVTNILKPSLNVERLVGSQNLIHCN